MKFTRTTKKTTAGYIIGNVIYYGEQWDSRYYDSQSGASQQVCNRQFSARDMQSVLIYLSKSTYGLIMGIGIVGESFGENPILVHW